MTEATGVSDGAATIGVAGRSARFIARPWTDERVRPYFIVGLLALAIYEVSREPGTQIQNHYVRLADSMLHGRLNLPDAPDWLEVARYNGRAYSHQGVLPGILLIPFVAVFGPDFNMRHFAALLGAGISVAAWGLATGIGLDGWRRWAGWAFPVLGTSLWFEAKAGTTWGVAALGSALFLFCSLNEYFGSRRLWLIGLLVAVAGMSRPSAGLALLGFALAVRRPRRIAELALGAAGPVLAVLAYNVLRFGTITDKSQQLHYMADGYRFQRPPGQFSLAHLPQNLHSWFFLGPRFQDRFPYLQPTGWGMAITLTSPAFVCAIGARRERWMWLAASCVLIPASLHYANGFTQFGMRYLLDAIPFVTALIFLALREDRAPGYLVLLGVSIAINAFGVAYTTVFGLPT